MPRIVKAFLVILTGVWLASCSSEEVQLPENLSLEKNVAFLEENKGKPGVQVTASGLQYRILAEGSGPKPGATSQVSVHYTGRLIDGTVFDSSEGGPPAKFPVNRLIKGWTEALQLMPEGSKWELVIPQDLAYGARGAGEDIPPYQTLVFDVEMVKVH